MFLLCLYEIALQQTTFTKVTISDADAKCLDGSSPIIYLSNTAGTGTIIYFEGGSLCVINNQVTTQALCNQRSTTNLGSTSKDTTELKLDYIALSNNQTINPVFSSMKKVYIRYCDGSLYQGNRNDPLPVAGKNLYFRGYKNVLATIKYLKDNNYLSGNVLVSGTSAGAIGAFLWANYIKTQSSGSVSLLMDSGLLLPVSSSKNQNVINAIGTFLQSFLLQDKSFFPLACTSDCFNQQTLMSKIDSSIRVMMIQSFYDSFNLAFSLNVNCAANFSLSKCTSTQLTQAQKIRTATLAFLKLPQVATKSYWVSSCSFHGALANDIYNYNSTVMRVNKNGTSVPEAVKTWWSESKLVQQSSSQGWSKQLNCWSGILLMAWVLSLLI